MQGQVDGLASQPEKLQTIRSEFEDLALQVTANDGQ
jgi:hypothetical protein